LCVGAVIGASDGDLRWGEIWELRDRQRGNRHGAAENDNQRANRRKNRALDKEINEQGSAHLPPRKPFAILAKPSIPCLSQREAASEGES